MPFMNCWFKVWANFRKGLSAPDSIDAVCSGAQSLEFVSLRVALEQAIFNLLPRYWYISSRMRTLNYSHNEKQGSGSSAHMLKGQRSYRMNLQWELQIVDRGTQLCSKEQLQSHWIQQHWVTMIGSLMLNEGTEEKAISSQPVSGPPTFPPKFSLGCSSGGLWSVDGVAWWSLHGSICLSNRCLCH